MYKIVVKILIGIAALALAACSSVGVVQPKDVTESVYQAKATVAGLYRTVGDYKSRGVITAEKRDEYVNQLEYVEEQLNLAESFLFMEIPDEAGALGYLQAANEIIWKLQTELK